MKKILDVIRWEFVTHFRSRTFLFATLFSPILVTLIMLFPTLFIAEESKNAEIVGLINFSDFDFSRQLARELNKQFQLDNGSPRYFLVTVSIDSSQELRQAAAKMRQMQSKRDSLSREYLRIKAEREAIFKQRRSARQRQRLEASYKELTFVREERDLSDFALNRQLTTIDSLYQIGIRATADRRLLNRQLNAYLILHEDIRLNATLEYHSLFPRKEEEVQEIRRVLNDLVIRQRMEADRISPSLRERWLAELKLETYQLTNGGAREFDYLSNYFGPIVIVFLLFLAIFTSSGFLFNGILHEKSNRIIELLASSMAPRQLMAGKIIGLGTLGLVQVLVWVLLTILLILLKAVKIEQMAFISIDNALLFIVYFILGYFLYAAIYVAIAALFRNEKDAQQVNTFLRIIAIFPVLMAMLVLSDPHSSLVRALGFIPLLTPTFMILRISLSDPGWFDILLSIAIMLTSIALLIRIAGRIFQMGILYEGEFPGYAVIRSWFVGTGEASDADVQEAKE
jgi:ABC-2 type transport system permease protein